MGSVAPCVVLFLTLIDDGNAILEHGEGDGVLDPGHVLLRMGEPSLVVVLEERAKETGVDPRIFELLDARDELADAGSAGGRLEGPRDPKVAGIVQQTCHVVLVGSKVGRIPVEDLAQAEHAGGLLELGPERGFHMLHAVDTQPVDLVAVDNVPGPLVPDVTDIAVFCAKVGQADLVASLPAQLDGPLVVVVDFARVMVIATRRKGFEAAVVYTASAALVPHVIGDHVDHEIHAPSVEGVREGDKIIRRSKGRVERVDVFCPVAVVR